MGLPVGPFSLQAFGAQFVESVCRIIFVEPGRVGQLKTSQSNTHFHSVSIYIHTYKLTNKRGIIFKYRFRTDFLQ